MKLGQLVWEQGLLLKGNGLCHGIAGNAYMMQALARTFEKVASRVEDEKEKTKNPCVGGSSQSINLIFSSFVKYEIKAQVKKMDLLRFDYYKTSEWSGGGFFNQFTKQEWI